LLHHAGARLADKPRKRERSRRITPEQDMLIARTRAELDAATRRLRAGGDTVALVPTMGALHAGHISLIKHARTAGSRAIASIFVNPLQFGPSEDLARYPRDEAGDLQKLRDAGCDAAWLPGIAEMYPPKAATFVDMAGPALGWEGDSRPGHFRGVATAVAKLFGQVKPDIACFGEKDWQQLQVITRFTHDLCLGVVVQGVPTLREADGLALSSRNRFLDATERARAPALHAALQRAAAQLRASVPASQALGEAGEALASSGMAVDYLALVDGASLVRIETLQPGARLIGAARLGSVRLLDNIDSA